MSSNLPPGCSGNEFEIAGPDTEVEDRQYCTFCASPQDGFTMTYSYQRWFVCETCDETTDMESLSEPDYPDPRYSEDGASLSAVADYYAGQEGPK